MVGSTGVVAPERRLAQPCARAQHKSTTEVQAISFVYFTSRGATLVWGKWANWVAMIPIPSAFIPNLLHYPMLAQHPLLVKYTKLMACTSVEDNQG